MRYLLQNQLDTPATESPLGGIEETIIQGVQALKLFIETIGALIIGVGVLIALFYIIKGLIPPQVESYNKIRLVLARYLALALEFQLGADILSTAIAPSWDQIGKLGAIAVIRTALNYFLAQEMKEERKAETEGSIDKTMVPDANHVQKTE
ncbi:DUF1622 domain-containing protein [Rufibacter sediminis]|uniref:DUF1622 domain-containing protein n=1 Tax=Rufibacter sediminis TaxID=2762756 RepID=A0ABR6VWQ0_9BACT|nr:DUF1622 domain-containing protein [Rufibacter sediminis]MBC3541621.1 DUF1622 domain-containing protein [Rufibacter sediminis]